EDELPGMERLTAEPLLHRLHARIALPSPAVQRIAEQGVSHLRQVDADLVRSPGLQPDLEKRGAVETTAHAPGRDRRLAGPRSPGEALPVPRMSAVKRLEAARVGRLAVDEREVGLLDAPGLERALERLESRVVLGDDEAA